MLFGSAFSARERDNERININAASVNYSSSHMKFILKSVHAKASVLFK